jgi:secreted protein with Ig-like and vWFA domain
VSLDHLDRQGTVGNDRVVVLVTAGAYDTALTARARASMTTIYTVGLGASVNTALLQDIAAQTGGTYCPVAQAAGLVRPGRLSRR